MEARLLRIALSCWLLAFSLYASHSRAAAMPAIPADPMASVDAFIEELMIKDRVPGVALVIVHDNMIVHQRGFGVVGPSNDPVTSQTPFVLGSMSKSFTALAVMQLVEAGTLALDAPVQRYLPWFTVADPSADRITVRHLLYHTSGIPTNAPQANVPNATLADHVRALADVRLVHPLGTVHEYASPNYQILGLIVEQVSGMTFADYIDQHIFTPLAMEHSFTDATAATTAGLATGHQYWFGLVRPAMLPHEPDRLPTAGLISSAEDLGHYLIAQLNDGRYGEIALLSPEGMAELHRPGIPADDFSYAMGWRVGPINDVPAIHHGGMLPEYRGKMVMLPEQGWGVAVLTNASSFFGRPTSHAMADGVTAILSGQVAPGQTINLGFIYGLLCLGLGLITLNQIANLFKLPRWRHQFHSNTRPGSLRWLPIAVELIFPVFLLVGLPALLGLSLSTLMQQIPDLTLWMIITAALGLLTGVLKLWFASRRPLRHASVS